MCGCMELTCKSNNKIKVIFTASALALIFHCGTYILLGFFVYIDVIDSDAAIMFVVFTSYSFAVSCSFFISVASVLFVASLYSMIKGKRNHE